MFRYFESKYPGSQEEREFLVSFKLAYVFSNYKKEKEFVIRISM